MTGEIIKSSTATIQVGVARADGKLSLTETKIIFEPYSQKLALGPYILKRDEIVSVEKCIGKGAGIMPVTSDAIRITLSDERAYEFIIAEPNQWIAAFGATSVNK
ncbi:hypothetical protein L3V31_15500 [Vibrio sp. J1-1]|uniref:hypothetical protein n=1 Tax=Vibrio sp. J1-1 TaxID=2912251 RepID=UPI001F30C221|nr:hypothetical protein [Vibrio sp. J1-1]MBR9875925.1 hypothetical protein [Vibrionaceae bacterium]MCF7483117.1 hypothetical protein [Vibrio sp. J1-1]